MFPLIAGRCEKVEALRGKPFFYTLNFDNDPPTATRSIATKRG